MWTEMLQGTLAASAGLSQAIMATAPLSPPTIRSATTRLSGRLSAGMASREVLLLFADELEDSSADRVVCALLGHIFPSTSAGGPPGGTGRFN